MKFSKIKPIKSLQEGRKNNAGRNNTGRITVRHQGGGHKRVTKKIELNQLQGETFVMGFEYSADRRTYLMRIFNNNKFSYMLAPKDVNIFDKIFIKEKQINLTNGSMLAIKDLSVGTLIHNLELHPNTKGTFIKSAGTFGKILYHDIEKNYTAVQLPSGESRLVHNTCLANIGVLSNENFFNFRRTKAGESRWLNIRPAVRGVAMNPIDHPHGGGQGKTSGGRPSVSPWAKLTKGKKTRLTKNKYVIKNL